MSLPETAPLARRAITSCTAAILSSWKESLQRRRGQPLSVNALSHESSPAKVVRGRDHWPPSRPCLPLLLGNLLLYNPIPCFLILLRDRLSKDGDEVGSVVDLEDGDDAAFSLLKEGLVASLRVCVKESDL